MRAALFDVFGTLLDVHSVTRRAEVLFPGRGAQLSLLWRERQIDYTRLRTMAGRYVPFAAVTRDALEYALEALGLAAGADDTRSLLEEYRRLAPFTDVAPALAVLGQAGVRMGVLSNGDSEMLETALVSAGLHRHIDLVLSAEQVRAFKTSPAVYALGPRALKLPLNEILFVSSNGWDACGAADYGYPSFWVNRTGAPLERLGATPRGIGRGLTDAAAFLLRQTSNNTREIDHDVSAGR